MAVSPGSSAASFTIIVWIVKVWAPAAEIIGMRTVDGVINTILPVLMVADIKGAENPVVVEEGDSEEAGGDKEIARLCKT